VTPLFPESPGQTVFDRAEMDRIMGLYGRMVAAGHWRDYAIAFAADAAVFSAFPRAADRPEYQVVKRPALARAQGQWALLGPAGAVLKRGHELAGVLAPVERKLLKLVGA
jgi:hypothetical protein